MKEIPESLVVDMLDYHTVGIVVSFFDQRQGPIPIIVEPAILKDNYGKLVELSDLSFSTCRFIEGFDSEVYASFDLTLSPSVHINSISFGFALDRPEARGGAENITLNTLIQPNVFPLVNQFIDFLLESVHEIHVLMDKSPSSQEKILEKILKFRKTISYLVLSYQRIYGTTELQYGEEADFM